ncbi:hypothetical protein Aglo03_48670 [Actinokineospora globicatena]|uniref:LigA protein n=1 Tax=Actinokineospora globicatena TaxID=103729 RepID=A0A9W6QNC8_9PSEU|nr:hypothetical protein Aglo03_48670 [Actinokineospora globicatena]
MSFFITARLAGQNHRGAFIENVMEQLSALLGEPLPALLTDATREAHLFGMLEDAAALCLARGERLTLLVDGLDEDRGVAAGPDDYSIAGMLPAPVPAGLNVVVASRSNPPLPFDVPDDHPLRDPVSVRGLSVVPAASAIRADMVRDLRSLLGAQPDLVGFTLAAGGGLTAADLAELTGKTLREVADRLASAVCRSFTARPGRWYGDDTYILGHEELLTMAADHLGDAMVPYRELVHEWVDSYRTRGWPRETPEYALHGYFRMLVATAATPRMVAIATDRGRIDLLQDVSGADSAALDQLTAVEDFVLRQRHPDLAAMARLTLERERLVDRNATIPVRLPAVWVALGRPDRAEALAESITFTADRIEAMALVVTALATHDEDAAHAVLARAENLAKQLHEPVDQRRARCAIATAVATTGDLDKAIDLLCSRPEGLADAAGEIGGLIETQCGARHSDVVINSIGDPATRLRMILAVATATANAERARRCLDDAVRLVSGIPRWQQQDVVRHIARAATHLMAHAAADALVHSLVHLGVGAENVIGARAEVAARCGDLRGALVLASTLLPTDRRVLLTHLLGVAPWSADEADLLRDRLRAVGGGRTARALAVAVAMSGDLNRATALAIRSADRVAMAAVAHHAAAGGEPEAAESLICAALNLVRADVDPVRRLHGVAVVAQAAARCVDASSARRLITIVEESGHRTELLDPLVTAVALTGDVDRATAIAGENSTALIAVAAAAAERGATQTALAVAARIRERNLREEALAMAAGAMIEARDFHRAIETIMPCKSESAWQTITAVFARLPYASDAQHVLDGVPREHLNAFRAALALSAESSGLVGQADAHLDGVRAGEDRMEALLAMLEAAAARRDPARVRHLSAMLGGRPARLPPRSSHATHFAVTAAGTSTSALSSFVAALEAAANGEPPATAHEITDPDQRSRVAVALANAGDEATAIRLVSTIASEYERGRGWHRVGLETALGPTGRPAAEMLRLHHWTSVIPLITRHHPDVVRVFVDEMQGRVR